MIADEWHKLSEVQKLQYRDQSDQEKMSSYSSGQQIGIHP
jgi:hypothetical protein